jgi:cytochrome c-type biogenesis protein CcmF
MQEKRGMMKVWNVWLIFATFLLSIFGTFLTRSGLVSSVHAFAQSSIGNWFVIFLGVIFCTCLFFYIVNREHLRSENRLESLISRESSFLFNNLVFLVSAFAVLWGTLFPVLSEYVQGNKVTVGAPFYNRVNVPIGLFLIFLTGVGPILAWGKTSLQTVQRNFRWPLGVAALGAVALMIGGVRPWQSDDPGEFYSLVAFALCIFVFVAITTEFWRGAGVIARGTGLSRIASAIQLTRRNTRRYGGYIVHYGVIIVVIGFAGSAFNQSEERELGYKDSMQIGPYTLVCQKYTQDDNPNYGSEMAILDVYKHGKMIATMYPERRFYKASQQAQTMVANHSTMREDLYLVYAGRNADNDKPIIKAHLNPLVMWIWVGVLIMALGTLVALMPELPAAAAVQRRPLSSSSAERASPAPEEVGVGD